MILQIKNIYISKMQIYINFFNKQKNNFYLILFGYL